MGRLAGTVIALIIGIVVVTMKFSARDDSSQTVHDEIVAYLEQIPDYNTYGSLYLQWFDAHHEEAFHEHYMMGGRRSSAHFNGNDYLDDVFEAMSNDAFAAGYKDQAANIEALRKQIDFE